MLDVVVFLDGTLNPNVPLATVNYLVKMRPTENKFGTFLKEKTFPRLLKSLLHDTSDENELKSRPQIPHIEPQHRRTNKNHKHTTKKE